MGQLAAPHPTAPFTIGRDGTAVADQGSERNITTNIYNIAVCPQGFRDELPGFGLPDVTFHMMPLDLDALQHAIQAWEPAANLNIEEHRTAVGEAELRIETLGGAG